MAVKVHTASDMEQCRSWETPMINSERNHGTNQVVHLDKIPAFRILVPLGALGAAAGAGVGLVGTERDLLIPIAVLIVVATFLAVIWFQLGVLVTISMLAFFLFLGMTNVRLTEAVAVSDAWMFIASGLLIATSILEQRRLSTWGEAPKRILWGAYLLVAGSLLSSLVSPDISASLSGLIRLTVSTLIIPIIVLCWGPTIPQIRLLTIAFVASASISAVVALIVGPPEGLSSTRAYGLATHPNSLALISILAIGPAYALTLTTPKPLRIAFLACTMLLSGCILMMAGSRAGAIGLAVCLGAILVSRRSWRALVGGIAIGLLVYLAISRGILDTGDSVAITRLFGSNGGSEASAYASDAARTQALRTAWSEFMTRPFVGVGLYRSGAAINTYLSILTTSGVLGLFGLFYVIKTVSGFGIWANTPQPSVRMDQHGRLLLTGWVAGYIGMMTANAFQNAIWERFVWIPPILIAILARELGYGSWEATDDGDVE